MVADVPGVGIQQDTIGHQDIKDILSVGCATQIFGGL